VVAAQVTKEETLECGGETLIQGRWERDERTCSVLVISIVLIAAMTN